MALDPSNFLWPSEADITTFGDRVVQDWGCVGRTPSVAALF